MPRLDDSANFILIHCALNFTHEIIVTLYCIETLLGYKKLVRVFWLKAVENLIPKRSAMQFIAFILLLLTSVSPLLCSEKEKDDDQERSNSQLNEVSIKDSKKLWWVRHAILYVNENPNSKHNPKIEESLGHLPSTINPMAINVTVTFSNLFGKEVRFN